MTVRVFLLDDHELMRMGVRVLLDAAEDLEVVGEAGTGAEALGRIPAVRPDVAVLDIQLGEGSGIEVCREIRSRHPEVACVMLTTFADDDSLFAAIVAGASAYVLKEVKARILIDAIREVAAGRSLLDPAMTARVLERVRAGPASDGPALDAVEEQILALIASGATNRQIAAELHYAEKTVKTRISALFGKLGVTRRVEAAAHYAARRDPPRPPV